ncbi:arsenate reductase (thioredoxin) [Alicyclobacillus sp. ALC3]|uniref:arsenate reductase (thioredoxin) n=1 Tax=Alicyclobacillus sp. ALC3 TaxID=2796143 RepID=UPI002378CB81|nr:arsenate reductase (thioredoxin) [Alicyclobacillus sp. ALC3]WDL99226.1 arsenate reductase (thioredoxin) [Alicyclobacillus sp. ALC3]
MEKPIVYFICTGNSCRSQMAEGWAHHFAGDKVTVLSGGIEAHSLNPKAIQVMQEAGIDMSNHTSDLIDTDVLNHSDYAITLCGDAYDKCPVTPTHVKRLHWGFEDPARAVGTEEQVMNKFREVRDAIKERVQSFVKELENEVGQ